jgi:hypothetical protein
LFQRLKIYTGPCLCSLPLLGLTEATGGITRDCVEATSVRYHDYPVCVCVCVCVCVWWGAVDIVYTATSLPQGMRHTHTGTL